MGTTKTFLDLLYDIVVDLPGLFEQARSPPRSESCLKARRMSVGAVEALQQDLDAWMRAWCSENPTVSTSVAVSTPLPRLNAGMKMQVQKPAGSETDSRLNNLNRALESLTFNATIICLSKLREMLANNSADDHEISPPCSNGETQMSIRIAREVVQQCAYIAQEIKSTRCATFLALAPVGVAYCALKGMGGLGDKLAGSIARMFHAERFLAELEVFEVWK